MPKVVGTRLMVKERGGKAQVAFRKALGIRGDQDVQFQEIKHRIRTLALKHFEIGRKPREQDKIIKERFLADVQQAFPIFEDDERASAHLFKYINQFLHSKAVPRSRFYQMVHNNDIADGDLLGDDDKSDDVEGDRNMPVNSEPPTGPPTLHSERSQMTEFELDEETSRSAISANPGMQDPVVTGMPVECSTLRKDSNQPRRASSASTVLASDDSCHTTPIRNFLGRAALGHLHAELMTLGIKNESRLLHVATWPEEDVNILLCDSVRERRIDKFEAQQLVIALRSLRRQSMRVDADD
ncbi:uncharacterized protein EDB93DRAFT_799400 [Suillus bovinus]|uniref:uncharacterized protein n=1 Tax=Suillus bovinus TaxID=48563 RepID=UPI001B872B7D|nr:uncharacterized protein EDB93DRAFT_799400 [Suillus bovinus]KAG2157570.1 hypothetical protein EDB93DRAFT_799400 [Suillus bovinus]